MRRALEECAVLAARELSLLRGGRLVLDRIDAHLKPGEITAICGPNGAGKSSLLLALAGLIAPAAGSVTLGEESLAALHPQSRAQRIGYLPQNGQIAWDLSVENLVRLGRLPQGGGGKSAGAAAVEKAIEALDLAPLRTRAVSTLSGGERSRVLLARVLAGEPQWILADEPLAALDLGHQQNLLSHFKSAARGGTGVAVVLHDLALAMNHADRVLVLRADGQANQRANQSAGRLVADGAPEAALSEEVIANCWGVSARWIGEKGARALIASER